MAQNITTTNRAAIAARLDAITADFCQIYLDARGREMSAEERAEVDALAEQMSALRRAEVDALAAETAAASSPAIPGAYNGYPNGETYTVIRCLDSNATHAEAAAAIVAAAWWNASDEVAADRAAIVAPRADAADALRAWLEEEENPLADTVTLFTDLLTHALARVDWGVVADHYAPNPLPSLDPLPDPEDGDDGDDGDDDEQPEEPEAEWRPWSRERED